MTTEITLMSTDRLIELRDQVDAIIAQRNWKIGDRVAWQGKSGAVNQGVIADITGGVLKIKKKGELQWSHAVPAGVCRRSIAAFR